MTIILEAEARLRQLSTATNEDAVRDQCYDIIFNHALPELLAHLGQPVSFETFMDDADPTRYEEHVAADLEKVQAGINEFYSTTFAAHLAAKKPWSQAMARVYQLQASTKATDAQVEAAGVAVENARVQFQLTLDEFMQARRAEECFRQAPNTYKAQSLPAIIWLGQNILRVHSYTPGSGYLTEMLLNELPTP